VAGPARAELQISGIEWAFLSPLCKSQLMLSTYSSMVPPELRLSRETALEYARQSAGMPGAHHFCAGLVHLNRAKRGAGSYAMAISEMEYTQNQMETNAPLFSYVHSYLGTAYYRAGKRATAMRMWSLGISTQPQHRECYLAMAEALLSEHKPQEALDVLLKFDEVKDTEYADVEHFIAQTYFDLKNYDEAKAHVEKAYALGYPVFGLRDKLKRIGKY
jgi:predicted Zn-dependent protease